MAGVSVAAEWQLLYNRYYRKPEIYTMQWSRMDLTRHRIAPAPFAGPIAAIRDDSKIVQLFAESARRKLHIFNSAGVLMSSAVWDRPGGRLVGMSWTDEQSLICVVQDGTVYRYNIHAELQEPHVSMGKECFEQNVVECVFWGNGMVCLTEANLIFCIPDFKNPKPCKLADPVLEEYPLCVAVIEPQYTMSGNVEVLLAVNDYVLVVDEEGVQQMGVGIGPLQKMAVSKNGKLLASFTHDGRLLVITTDFSKIIFEYNCESSLPPEQLAWCGLDSVLLYWEESLLMVGPYGDPVRYFFDEPIILIPECDGVRILSSTSTEFLHRVPDSTVDIFKIGSTLPAALLYDALDHFDRRSAKASTSSTADAADPYSVLFIPFALSSLSPSPRCTWELFHLEGHQFTCPWSHYILFFDLAWFFLLFLLTGLDASDVILRDYNVVIVGRQMKICEQFDPPFARQLKLVLMLQVMNLILHAKGHF
ncbi:vacuolar protein sorting-associated protein 16 [Asimina triloba]